LTFCKKEEGTDRGLTRSRVDDWRERMMDLAIWLGEVWEWMVEKRGEKRGQESRVKAICKEMKR
jgi:hypothetical protein